VLPSHDSILQARVTENIPLQNIFPDDPVSGAQYWQEDLTWFVPAGTKLSDTDYWVKGDNRDQQMLLYFVDIALYHVHSRISPRNIPQLRIDRYNAAISWLKMCANGDVTPALPVIQPKQGARIRYGGNIKNINSY
jgi:hypothetical protein